MGTYSGVGQNENPVGSADYVYLSNETKYTPMTGETNGLNPPRTDGDNAVTEMDATNWSTLNRDYFTQNITNWINSGHYPEILRRLGYRFVFRNGTYHVNGTSLSVSIDIENVGFARLALQRNVILVLRNTSNNNLYSFTLDSDPRTWEGQITVSQLIDISSIPNGNYAAYLKLADPNPTLATRSEYSIRFANSNVWDNQHGYNDLNYTFDIITLSDVKSINNSDSALLLYPNPAENVINIKRSFPGETLGIFIYAVDGMLHKSYINNNNLSNKKQIDISSLISGSYILKLKTEQKTETAFFIKM